MTANTLRRWSSNLLLVASMGSLVAMAYPSTRPTAKVVVACVAGSRQCSFNGRSSLNAVSYRWSFGTSQPDELRDSVTNTFPAGSWCVKLVVYGSAGDSSYATKLISVPAVANAKYGACPAKPAPAKVDTVRIHDTIAVAISINSPFPNVAGLFVDSLWASQGYRIFRVSLLGQVHTVAGQFAAFCNPNGWPAPQPNNSVSLGVFPSVGRFQTMGASTALLDTLTQTNCKP